MRNELDKFRFDFNHYLETKNTLDQISSTLNLILQLLTDIENSVTFAKLGTLHPSILKIDELESILDKILKYHSVNQLIFPYNSNDTHKYYNLVEVEAYYSGTKIVFVVHFPIVYPEIFSYYHLYSIPTQNLTTIVPKNTYLVMNENFYQYASMPCIKLHPSYYCPENKLIYGIHKEDCIFQLLQLSTHENCQETPIQITKNVIQQIDESHYIAVFPNPTKIRTACQRTDLTTLKGNYLINIPFGCQFETNDSTYINEKSISGGQPMLLPEITIQHKVPVSTKTKILIEDVQLDKIHELQKQQRRLAPVVLTSSEISWTSKFWTIPLYIILIFTGLYLAYKFIQKRRRTNNQPGSDQSPPSTSAFFTP